MNSLGAASLLDNPWVIVVIVIVGVISNWLMKRRQAGGLASPTEIEAPPSRRQPERSARQPDLQEVLRQLLGGEPSPKTTPPLIPAIFRDEQIGSGRRDEEELDLARVWPGESLDSDATRTQWQHPAADRWQRQTVAAPAIATHSEAEHRHEHAVHQEVPLDGEAEQSVLTIGAAHRSQGSMEPRAVRPWRDPRLVRRAFVASLVFAQPKGLEG